MNWVKKHNLLAIEMIQFNRCLCIKIKVLWNALHLTFNSAQNQQINNSLLGKLLSKQYLLQNFFSREEFKMTINKYNNLSAPGPDRISQKYLKCVVKDDKCFSNIVNITNAYINLGHWPSHFKKLSSIIISKPNKTIYDSPKSF